MNPAADSAARREPDPGADEFAIGPRLDAALLDRLRAGDQDAWHQFLVAYHDVFARSLRLAAMQIGGSVSGLRDEDPSLLVAEAQTYFYHVFLRRFSRYVGEPAFRAWLFHTVKHFLHDRRRGGFRDRRRAGGGGLDEVLDEIDGVSARRWRRAEAEAHDLGATEASLADCLGRLRPPARATVVLRHMQTPGLTLEEQARAGGESAWTLQKRYQRALAALRQCLEGKGVRLVEGA
jgi:RNA polymerase sigma factor (sigma-70 family)